MPKKPRSDSKLNSLPLEQKELLVDWLVEENLSYKDAVERVEDEFGVSTSTGAMSTFYSTACWQVKIERSRELADSLGDAGETDEFEAQAMKAVRQKFFELSLGSQVNLKDLKALAKIIGDSKALQIRVKDLEIKERRIELLEKKAAMADQAEGIMGSQLTEEEKAQRMRQLFGM